MGLKPYFKLTQVNASPVKFKFLFVSEPLPNTLFLVYFLNSASDLVLPPFSHYKLHSSNSPVSRAEILQYSYSA